MRKQNIFLLVVIAFFLIACATPKINTEDLKTGIDAARSGHYGQAMLHQELSEKDLGTANRILSHLEKGHYHFVHCAGNRNAQIEIKFFD